MVRSQKQNNAAHLGLPHPRRFSNDIVVLYRPPKVGQRKHMHATKSEAEPDSSSDAMEIFFSTVPEVHHVVVTTGIAVLVVQMFKKE